jgi:hypothetical protein
VGVNSTVVVKEPTEEGIVGSVIEKVPGTPPLPPVKVAELAEPPY